MSSIFAPKVKGPDQGLLDAQKRQFAAQEKRQAEQDKQQASRERAVFARQQRGGPVTLFSKTGERGVRPATLGG